MGSDARLSELLEKIIGFEDFKGRDELLAQVTHVRIVGGPVTFYELKVDTAAAPRSSIETPRVSGSARVAPGPLAHD